MVIIDSAMIKISVILPCYNVEPFLQTIFNDLQAQVFEDGEIEWIFVDDGGNESQVAALDALKEHDSRVVVLHKKNGGLASARNVGISAARGEWIVFVDPDDRLKSDHISRLYRAVTRTGVENVDLGIGGYDQHFEGETRVAKMHLNMQLMNNEPIVSAEKCFRQCPELIFVSAWSKIYRTTFLRENNLRFDEHLKFNEDVIFNAVVFKKARMVACIPDTGYIYIKYYNRGICSTFNAGIKSDNIQRIEALQEVQRTLGYREDEILFFQSQEQSLLAYLVACNPFKQNSPYNLARSVKYLKSEIFDDVEMMQAITQRDTSADNRALRLCFGLIKTKSPWLLGIAFWILYRMKYKMKGLFIWLKRQGVKD